MYNKEHYDHMFSRMRQCLPQSSKLYFLIAVVKLIPLFCQVHTGGYQNSVDSLTTLHTYFRYFSMTFYIENSFGVSSIVQIAAVLLALNITCILFLIYYLSISKKVKKIDENYGSVNSLHYIFNIFSIFVFFKYMMLFQFFAEINFFPLLCIEGVVDVNKITVNDIIKDASSIMGEINTQCTGTNFAVLLFLSIVNIIIDVGYHYLLSSRFFDFNTLSNYRWNFSPNFINSFLFLENLSQIFLILFLNFENRVYKLYFGIYVYFLLFTYIYKYFSNKEFSTTNAYYMIKLAFYSRTMSVFSQIFIQIFQFGLGLEPNDVNIIGLIIVELVISYLFAKIYHRNDKNYISCVLVSNLNKLNEKNIYNVLIFLIREFRIFSDLFHRFSDNNLDIFLENYVEHLKCCEDYYCPCKNYIKKVTGNSNTIKTGYTTVINFTHMRKDNQEEYILNKFFNVLAANISTTIKYTNNVNINNIKDSQRQKLIYQLRTKLITAVKKLLSYRLEILSKNIDSIFANNFSEQTKDFIRINYFAVSILCNKSFYKTQFLYYEHMSEFYKRKGNSYRLNLIYYFYLKMFAISEYQDYCNSLKQGKKEHASFQLDFRTVMSLCVKYYEIEERLVTAAKDFEAFISYFGKNKIVFDKLLQTVKKFKADYKNITRYTRHFFKNDKINNLFVCTKIVLLFKILQFDIPETLHNKLIIQSYDGEELQKTHSYIDSNYYIIANYANGDFIMKFISHELLIVLEYSEDELRDQDFHLLMPEKLRRLHKSLIISEIKGKSNYALQAKEIFFVSKKKTCVLFDLQYKILLNLKGEITLLCVINLKKPAKDYRVCFACIDDGGEILALNREFEEYLVLSMKVMDYVKLDTEKLILQNMGPRMKTFFKDEDNTEFQDQFDYELYLMSLFGEEFENLKEKNEKEYKKKLARWEVLKEMSRKARYYSRYIELNIKQRTIGKDKIYFIKYSVKITLSLRSIEPHNTTLSLIHAVKISKREMAKLSFYHGEEIYENKSDNAVVEDKINESRDDLFESQSQISSAIYQLKERNSVRLFRQKRNRFKFLPKSRNILVLMVIIGVLAVGSISYNISSLLMKTSLYQETQEAIELNINSYLLKKEVFYLCSNMINLNLLWEGIITYNSIGISTDYALNTQNLLELKIAQVKNVTYDINYLNSLYFRPEINEIMEEKDEMEYIFSNGYIYTKKNVSIFKEISNIDKSAQSLLSSYRKNIFNPNFNFKNYFFMNKVRSVSNGADLHLSDDDIAMFFIMNNLFTLIEPYLDKIISTYEKIFEDNQKSTLISIIIIKLIEWIIVVLIIVTELIFIFIGYEKAKRKMISLRIRIERNNVELTLKKVDEFIRFSNSFNICSLYFIAELDLKKVDEKDKEQSIMKTGTVVSKGERGGETPSPSRKRFHTVNTATKEYKEKENDLLKPTESNLINSLREGLSPPVSPAQRKLFQEPLETEKTPQNLDDNRHTFMKSIQKLEQIKSTKKSGMPNICVEKKDTDKSKTSSVESSIHETEIMNHLEPLNEKLEIEKDILKEVQSPTKQQTSNKLLLGESSPKSPRSIIKKNKIGIGIGNISRHNDASSNSDSNGHPDGQLSNPLKSVLKSSNISNKNVLNITRGAGEDSHCEDDSKVNMIRQEDQSPIGLIRKNTSGGKTPKVRFTDRNIKFYVPEKNVNDISELSPQQKAMAKIEKRVDFSLSTIKEKASEKTLGTIISEAESVSKNSNSKIDSSNPSKSMIVEVNSYINKEPKSPGMTNYSEVNEQSLQPARLVSSRKMVKDKELPQELDLKDFKDNDMRKFKLLDQGDVVTVKKKQDLKSKDMPKKEIIEDHVDSIVHNNCFAKLILFIATVSFIMLYLASILLNLKYYNSISNAQSYSNLLLNKVTRINMLLVKYKLTLIQNNRDADLSEYLTYVQKNLNDLIQFKKQADLTVLQRVNEMEMKIADEKSCEYLSEVFFENFNNTSQENELTECSLVGMQKNKNGISSAYSNILNTMISLSEDWKKVTEIDENQILAKLNDMAFIEGSVDIDYTIRKYDYVLSNRIVNDVMDIFQVINNNESIFSYFSIILNVIFLICSLVFIIYPIKYVEMLISWLIQKLMKN